ncbi:Riboflavin kinase [Candidatus Bilamarchaeum dharawalense]|uniref:Riboflavin kinase n=1 Tax=Candidatus Bilamarchaeum dharawalense TaxID=2885759 RepID=A0A5E4LQU5_9ARCH|nr:Riboflavin kinase [Candidatus Bilamarchaeum dharawalense]
MDELIFALLKHGAYLRPIRITTTELGRIGRMSQQNASYRLQSLEKNGMVQRNAEGIVFTKKAKDEIARIYADMKTSVEGEKFELNGKIVSGLGEGKFYLSLEGYRKQIRERFGFRPFPGTLNIELNEKEMWKKQQVLGMEPVVIMGFKDRDRTYGDLFSYRCKIEGRECVLIIPIRTHHGPKVIEIISQFNLKKTMHKKDGDSVRVVF